MPRGGWKRTWVKLFIGGWLHGSIRWQLEPAERGTWADLIAMAGECGMDGRICDNDGRPFPILFIANQLNIPIELLGSTIAKCKAEGRIENDDGVITISNWKAYQSEYERQKQYRGSKGETAPKHYKKCPECHYLIEATKVTEGMEICPLCNKQGKEVILVLQEGGK